MWEPFSSPYTVDVANPEKKKKYYGMKKFTAYEVTIVGHHGNITAGRGRDGEEGILDLSVQVTYDPNLSFNFAMYCIVCIKSMLDQPYFKYYVSSTHSSLTPPTHH